MATWIVNGKVEFEIEREVKADSEEEAIKMVQESIESVCESYANRKIEIIGEISCCLDGWRIS